MQALKSGKFISPHLIRYNERICINNREITDNEISEILERISKKIDTYNKTHEAKVKEFDVLTMIALIYFIENNCDLVVLETGMGGLYDSTNIVQSIVSVITDIGFDHTEVLGDTIDKITSQKAGIIKQNSDTVMYDQKNVTEIISKTCNEKNTKLHLVNLKDIKNYEQYKEYQKIDYKNYKDIYINLKGKCQTKNASLAIECAEILNEKGYKIDEEAIKRGLRTVIHKARFEKIYERPQIIFDGGHNENAIKNFKENVDNYYKNDKRIYIVSILKRKDYKKAIKLLTEDKEAGFIFTSGNDINKYATKEELYKEATKYLNKNIYKLELKEAIKTVLEKDKDVVIFVIRKFLCV